LVYILLIYAHVIETGIGPLVTYVTPHDF